jgi:hypothetical protein
MPFSGQTPGRSLKVRASDRRGVEHAPCSAHERRCGRAFYHLETPQLSTYFSRRSSRPMCPLPGFRPTVDGCQDNDDCASRLQEKGNAPGNRSWAYLSVILGRRGRLAQSRGVDATDSLRTCPLFSSPVKRPRIETCWSRCETPESCASGVCFNCPSQPLADSCRMCSPARPS